MSALPDRNGFRKKFGATSPNACYDASTSAPSRTTRDADARPSGSPDCPRDASRALERTFSRVFHRSRGSFRADERPNSLLPRRHPLRRHVVNRADSRYPIRNNIVHTPILQNPKRHGEYAYAHPASGDPSGGRDPTDLMYEGVHVRHWHGQEAVSADHAIARHHPPPMCAVTSPHSFGTGILCTFHGHPCMLLPHSVVRASEGGLMREDIDAVTRVAPPSTTAAPNKNDFPWSALVPDPEVLWVCSPCPAPGQPRDAQHMDYALVAVHLPPELPEEWLRSLEDSAAYGFARRMDNRRSWARRRKDGSIPCSRRWGKPRSEYTGATEASRATAAVADPARDSTRRTRARRRRRRREEGRCWRA